MQTGLRAITARWDEVLSEVSRTPRNEIGASIKKLQAIKTEVEAAEADDCTSNARVTLLSAMAAASEALGMFQKETGSTVSEATNQKLQQGVDTLVNAKREMDACRPK